MVGQTNGPVALVVPRLEPVPALYQGGPGAKRTIHLDGVGISNLLAANAPPRSTATFPYFSATQMHKHFLMCAPAPSFLHSEGESWVSFADAGRRGKGQVVVAELLRCAVGERRMRSHAIVIVAPCGKHGAGLGERRECRLVQALVAQPADEALGERVLLRLAGLDVVPVDAGSPGSTSGSPCW